MSDSGRQDTDYEVMPRSATGRSTSVDSCNTLGPCG